MAGCDVLVTGAGGFVGRHLVERGRAAGRDVRAFEGDIRDRGAAVAQVLAARPRAVVHLAAPARTGAADGWSLLADELAMAAALLEAVARSAPEAPVLMAGTAAQYGMATDRPLREDDPTEPVSAYGAAKCVVERAVTAVALNHGVRVIWARSFNHVGPGQPAGAPVADWARQVAAAGGAGTEIRVGSLAAVRDFLDVRDVADAYLALVDSDAAGVVNVCSGRPLALADLAERLRTLSPAPVEFRPDPALERDLDPPYVVGDPARLRALTGWEPRISLDQSLRDVLADLGAAPAAAVGAGEGR